MSTQAGYRTRPMSAKQARSLLARLYNVLSNRMALTTGATWLDNGQRDTYYTLNKDLRTAQSNISKIKKNGAYDIQQHEDPIPPNTQTPEDPDDYAKFILKSMDGIAVINTILTFNDIRSQYFNDTPDGNLWANGVINSAYRAIRKVDETYRGNQDTPWKNLNPAYIKNFTDGNRKKRKRVYPHFEKADSNSPWYNFTKVFYKYYNTIIIDEGTSSSNPYWKYIPDECKNSSYGFKFDENFNTITGYSPSGMGMHAAQKDYIQQVLSQISPTDKPNSKNDFVKYVKSFVNDTIRLNSQPNADDLHPIASVFDYYLLDYLIQILENEYTLFKTLRDIYAWTKSTTSRENDELRQFNDAPFYYSTCNGASCVGLCYGSCANTCNGCGGCTSFCTTACGGSCKNDCATCSGGCEDDCKSACGADCDASCGANCKSDCTGGCSTGCTGCKSSCHIHCISSCNEGCLSGCKDGCKTNCKDTCGNACGQGCGAVCKFDSTAPAIVNTTQGTTTYGGPDVSTYTVMGDNGVAYIVAATNPSTGQTEYLGEQSQNYSPNAQDLNNPGNTDSTYQNKYPSGGPPPVPPAPKLVKSIP